MTAVEAADHLPLSRSIAEFHDELDDPHVDPATDTWVGEIDGVLVAYGVMRHHPSGQRLERAVLDGFVHPEHRRRGVGGALLDLGIRRARVTLSAAGNDLPRYVRASAFDWCVGDHRLFEAAGMRPVRWFEDLGRPLDDVPVVVLDPSVTIVPFTRPDEVRDVHNEAFGDHWGSIPATPSSWAHFLAGEGVRPDLSFVALADDRVVGYLVSSYYAADVHVTGHVSGWVDTLGVRRAWRQRGVASALIATALGAYRHAGFDRAMIGVDADNPTGAARLYRALGFERAFGGVTYELQV